MAGLKEAFDKFHTLLKEEFEQPVLKDWPSANVRLKYPSLVFLRSHSRFMSFPNRKHLGGNHFIVGDWEVSLKIHQLSKSSSDQVDFIEKLSSFFTKGAEDYDPSITFSFGENPSSNATVYYLGHRLIEDDFALKKGERRVIVDLTMDLPKIVSVGDELHTILDPQIQGEISESVSVKD